MGAPDLLNVLQGMGLHLSIHGTTIHVRPREAITEEARRLIREHKADCQGHPKFPQLWQLNLPHPVQESFASSARTSPAFSFSLSR